MIDVEHARAVKIFGPGTLRVVQEYLEPLPDNRVRIRFRAGGICGSDMHYFSHARNGDFAIVEPLTLGHELAGEIAALGCGVSGLSVGDHVAVNPSRSCGACDYCRAGRANLCQNGYFMGSASRLPHMQGGFASLFDVSPEQCIVVPKEMPMDSIALAEPLAVCLHAVSRAPSIAGTEVAIMGCGPIGLLTAMAARKKGAARVTLFDLEAGPLKRAEALGFQTLQLTDAPLPSSTTNRFDVVFEAAGAPAALATALGIVRRGGTIVQIGNISGGAVPVPINLVMGKEVDLRGSFRFDKTFSEAVDLIISGAIDTQALISSRHKINDAQEAFSLALDRAASMKVMLMAN
jgi:L-idonate 5-dehydrogenase